MCERMGVPMTERSNKVVEDAALAWVLERELQEVASAGLPRRAGSALTTWCDSGATTARPYPLVAAGPRSCHMQSVRSRTWVAAFRIRRKSLRRLRIGLPRTRVDHPSSPCYLDRWPAVTRTGRVILMC